jgi:glycosyltransferase 2 family protein
MGTDAAGGAEGAIETAADPPVPSPWQRWRSIAFAPIGDGQRRRRGSDGIRVAAAVVGLLACLLVISYGYRVDRTITRVVNPPPGSIDWLVTTVYDVGAFGVAAVLVVLALVARRWAVARDLGVSVLATGAVTGLLILILGADGGRGTGTVIDGYSVTFPVFQIAAFMAIATAALPYLARTVQRLVELVVVLVAMASVVGGHGLPVNVLGSLAIGWGVTAAVHLVFGSPLGLPSTADVAALLGELGVRAVDVSARPRQEWGVARFGATLEPGTDVPGGQLVPDDPLVPGDQLAISVYGRDAADAKLLAKTGRFVMYRDSGPTLTFTRLQQVEHEAYLTLRAAQAGVTAPEVVEAGQAGPSGDAVLVCRLPAGSPLSTADDGDASDRALDDVFAQLLTLRAARLAHGEISGETVLVDPATETAALTNFRSATTNAGPERLDRDLAGALAAIALAVGAERASATAARCLPADVLSGVLGHLRRAGLDPNLVRALRGRKALLDDVRERAAALKGIDVPKLVEPRRISWANLILVVGTLVGGWALIGVLIDVTRSFDTIVGADWVWVVAAFVLAQLAFAASAVEDLGSVAGDLPFNRVLGLEVANSFSGVAGGTAAIFATRVRFFQQQGYDASVAISSSASVTAASWFVKGVLFVISLPLAWSAIHLEVTPESGGNSKTVWIILAVVVLVAVVTGLLLAVPRLRRLASDKLRPRLRDMWANARAVARSPLKMAQLFGGTVVAQLLVALALAVSLRAFDDHLSLATLIVVITLAGMIGGVSPVPGGVGVVEAGLILGLTAAGISEVDATAAVFVQRLFTAYLPPIWGWFSLMWLRRHEYV